MIDKIPRINFRDDNPATILAGVNMEQVKSVVFDKFLPNIKNAIDKNRKECIFCHVKNYNVIIPKSEYKVALSTLEKYYAKKEDFEKCSQIIELSSKL